MEQLGLGALHSKQDSRTFTHPTMGVAPMVIAGEKYLPEEHEHQHYVGICTAISLVQNAEKVFSKKYSPDFQYLLQKKFIDGNWDEGSAIFSALKVGKNFGFLPIEQFTWVTEEDRKLPYPQYIAKLQAVPDSEITRLLTLCKDKVTAYAQIDISSRDTIAKAIYDSEAGILCRYEVGNEWWTPSWNSADINPLKAPQNVVSGHAITGAYIENTIINLANTWGKDWNEQGNGDADYANYKPTEAWIPYYNNVPSPINQQLKNLTLQKTLLERIIELFSQLKNKTTMSPTEISTIPTKKWYQSKTVWFNLLTIIAQIIAFMSGVITNPNILAYLMVAQSIVNLILRKVTVQPIN